MIQLLWPWLLLALPLPLLLRKILSPSNQAEDAALRVPFIDDFNNDSNNDKQQQQSRWLMLLSSIAWICLVLASSRPQWLGEPLQLPVSGRDLMMAVDLSGSMQIEDFSIKGQTVDRLTATKYVARSFIERREGDRLGLILFGRQAYLQTPLTFDRETVNVLLQEALIGLAGKETAIGDAIGLAIKRLQDKSKSSRVLILLTDGANTAGEVTPLKAAELAAEEGLKIYTIGIGADEMVRYSIFGAQRFNPSADLDEKTLRAIAEKTGGQYFRARDTDELENIYTQLDQLEPVEQETKTYRPVSSLYYWPLAIAFVIATLISLLRLTGVTR